MPSTLRMGSFRGLIPRYRTGHRATSVAARTFACSSVPLSSSHNQSASPLGPIGVDLALAATKGGNFKPAPSIYKEFDLSGRIGIVSGGNRGLGLEMALALSELGARIYCIDLPQTPGEEWQASKDYVEQFDNCTGGLEYVCADVTDQAGIWDAVRQIGDKEKRIDVCVAAAGIHGGADCLEYPEEEFQKVMSVNTNGVLYTAQAAGRQMTRFEIPGSIILIASMNGSIANKGSPWIAYNTSKSAVLQMARSMACELGPKKIRVNSLSPGYIRTKMTTGYLEEHPHALDEWSGQNPLGRIGNPHELRGVIAWLASDSSTFCTGSDIIVDGGHRAW